MIKNNIQKNKGYTLLFAVLVSSLVLSVGISILTVSRKEFLLSSSARESTTAFYAADSALECAVYYDFNTDAFSTADISFASKVSCAGHNPVVPTYDLVGDETRYTYDINLNNLSCADVTVTKNSLTKRVNIEAKGYNVGWNGANCTAASPKRVERALYYSYSTQ
jgi:hypothetical protein